MLLLFKMTSLTDHVTNLTRKSEIKNRTSNIIVKKTEFIADTEKSSQVNYSNLTYCSNILHYGHWEEPQANELSHEFQQLLAGNRSMIWKLDSDKTGCHLHYYSWVEAYQCFDTVNKLKENKLKGFMKSYGFDDKVNDILIRMVGDSRIRQYFVTLLAFLEGKNTVYDSAENSGVPEGTTERDRLNKYDKTLVETAFKAKILLKDVRTPGVNGRIMNAALNTDKAKFFNMISSLVMHTVYMSGAERNSDEIRNEYKDGIVAEKTENLTKYSRKLLNHKNELIKIMFFLKISIVFLKSQKKCFQNFKMKPQ